MEQRLHGGILLTLQGVRLCHYRSGTGGYIQTPHSFILKFFFQSFVNNHRITSENLYLFYRIPDK